jgi:hypothetical protein
VSEQKSPLARLVLFMVCLSIVGVLVSGAYVSVVEQPQRNSLTAPQNGNGDLTACFAACEAKYWRGTNEGVLKCAECFDACAKQYLYG